MYPGLGGGGDAAKFRYLGHVLGTAHPPGYPLYVMLSSAFSNLPFATLAYRINLLSAVCGALTAGATYLSVRSLGGRRAAAVAAALGLAFGRLMWSKAVVAEVYALGACLTAATTVVLLRWRATGRASALLLAVAFASLGFGNHLTIAFAVPAFVAFALLNDARSCLRPRILAASAAIVALGISQYLYIVVRTYQNAPALESKATNLSELWDVLTARRYATDIFSFTWTQLFTERVPALAAMFRQELTLAGLLLLAAGVIWMVRARWKELGLLVLGALGIVVVTLNVWADSEGFVVPAFVFVWPLVGLGFEATFRIVDRIRVRAVAAAIVVVIASAVPAALVASNLAFNNHSRRVFEDVYFGSLFAGMAPKTVVTAEEYSIDQVVLYELLGAEVGRGRDLRWLPLDVSQVKDAIGRGYGVVTFSAGKKLLEGHGLVFEPMQLLGQPLPEYLRAVRDGWVVALAATPEAARGWSPAVWKALSDLGVATDSTAPGSSGQSSQGFAAIGVRGVSVGSVDTLAPGAADVKVDAGSTIGRTSTKSDAAVRVAVDGSGAAVWMGNREIVRAGTGAVVAVMTPGGRLVDAAVIEPTTPFRVPIDMRQLPSYRMTFAGRCEELGNTPWKDVSRPLSSGAAIARIDNFKAFDARMTIYAASDDEQVPVVSGTAGAGHPRVETRVFDTADRAQAEALRRQFEADGVADVMWQRPERRVIRVSLDVNDGGDFSTTTIQFGHAMPYGLARATVDLNNPRRATLCSVPPAPSRQ
jgi:4-amino-4-deoxy-L-arabinose transferase-like glycosyltransferase